jgi:transcriptional regulator with XRE-family HTH domain
MITSRQRQFYSEIIDGRPIPEEKLLYFRERLRDRLHSAILGAFQRRAEKGFKQSDLAERIHKKRAQIARWLGSPSNLTLDSISDLMIGLGMDFDEFRFTSFEEAINESEVAAPGTQSSSGMSYARWPAMRASSTLTPPVNAGGIMGFVEELQKQKRPGARFAQMQKSGANLPKAA